MSDCRRRTLNLGRIVDVLAVHVRSLAGGIAGLLVGTFRNFFLSGRVLLQRRKLPLPRLRVIERTKTGGDDGTLASVKLLGVKVLGGDGGGCP